MTSYFQTYDTPSASAHIADRITALRAHMKKAGIDVFLVPHNDRHFGEEVPPCDQRLSFITGFTGSAGYAIIAQKSAALFVDGRYTLQGPRQTDTKIFQVRDYSLSSQIDFLKQALPAKGSVGFDPWLTTRAGLAALTKGLGNNKIKFVPVDNLIDAIWQHRPAAPAAPIKIHPLKYAGQSSPDKIAAARAALPKTTHAAILTNVTTLCWLLNIRGNDVANTPITRGFVILHAKKKPELFTDPAKLAKNVKAALSKYCSVKPDSAFLPALAKLGEKSATIQHEPSCPEAVISHIAKTGGIAISASDPCAKLRSHKNQTEINGTRAAHLTDGVAMAKFLCWLDREAPNGKLSEIEIAQQLETFRREDKGCKDVSFDTISGAGANGAIIHYRVNQDSNRTLKPGELMLVDSGAQYLSGTTDITRTIATGKVSAKQKDHYTRVLKGMIAISMAKFPKTITGAQLDTLARNALWQAGLNYNHGTGHGVGSYLAVHEGHDIGLSISPRATAPLEAGYILSNEPGFYLEGKYGIRIENLVLSVPSKHDGFNEFETLTLAPIDTRLINYHLLTRDEFNWLNAYHRRVWQQISPLVTGPVKKWLRQATKAAKRHTAD